MVMRRPPGRLSHGYMMIYQPDYPSAKAQSGYVSRARLVAEIMIGRPLRPGEIVHHKNRIRYDDRPENLEVLPSQSVHIALHNRDIRRGRKLTESQVREIKILLAQPPTPRIRRRHRVNITGRPRDPLSILSIATQYHVSCGTIQAIKDGVIWRWVA